MAHAGEEEPSKVGFLDERGGRNAGKEGSFPAQQGSPPHPRGVDGEPRSMFCSVQLGREPNEEYSCRWFRQAGTTTSEATVKIRLEKSGPEDVVEPGGAGPRARD